MPYYTGAGSFSGFEYTVSPDGGPPTPEEAVFSHGSNPPYAFADIQIECPERTIITGHSVSVRYFELEIEEIPPPTDEDGNPIGEPTYNSTLTYPAWNLTHQEFQRAEEKFYFERELGNNLYAAPFPAAYGTAVAGISDVIFGPPRPPAPDVDTEHPDYVPLPDDNAYSYCRIFDRAEIEWIPRLSPPGQPALNGKNASIPTGPHDPEANPPIYPFDAIVGFVPDPRDSVNITYTLLTESDKGNESVTINHLVLQTEIDVGEKMVLFMEKSYYYNDYIHVGLYPPDTPDAWTQTGRNRFKDEAGAPPPYYNDDRTMRYRVRNEPRNIVQLTRRTYPYDESIDDWRPYPEQGACYD